MFFLSFLCFKIDELVSVLLQSLNSSAKGNIFDKSLSVGSHRSYAVGKFHSSVDGLDLLHPSPPPLPSPPNVVLISSLCELIKIPITLEQLPPSLACLPFMFLMEVGS